MSKKACAATQKTRNKANEMSQLKKSKSRNTLVDNIAITLAQNIHSYILWNGTRDLYIL